MRLGWRLTLVALLTLHGATNLVRAGWLTSLGVKSDRTDQRLQSVTYSAPRGHQSINSNHYHGIRSSSTSFNTAPFQSHQRHHHLTKDTASPTSVTLNQNYQLPPPKLDGPLTSYPIWEKEEDKDTNDVWRPLKLTNRKENGDSQRKGPLAPGFLPGQRSPVIVSGDLKTSESKFLERYGGMDEGCHGGHCHMPPKIIYKIKKIYVPKPVQVIKHVPIVKHVPVVKYKYKIKHIPVIKKKVIIKKIKVPVKVKVPYIKIKKIKVPIIKKIKVPVIRKVIKYVPKIKKVKHVHVHKASIYKKKKKKKKKKMKKLLKKMKKWKKKKKMKKKLKKVVEAMEYDDCHGSGFRKRGGIFGDMPLKLPDHCYDEKDDDDDDDEDDDD